MRLPTNGTCSSSGSHPATSWIQRRGPRCSSSFGKSNTQPTDRLRVGKRWPEYQGADNWRGLLDPLDDTLRSELLRYGRFVRAAYNAFDFDPSSPQYARCRFPDESLLSPAMGYRVTRHLHASSSVQLPRPWADFAPHWVQKQSAWIGYVAVCEDEEEIARLGRRDVVVVYRGTATCLEWFENLRAGLKPIDPNDDDGDDDEGGQRSGAEELMVESGFWSLFTSAGVSCRSLRQEVRSELERIIGSYGGGARHDRHNPPLSLTFTGHSLGAALAILTAYDVTTAFPTEGRPPVTVFSYGGPRVGNARFQREVEERGSKVLRIVNTRDIVTKVPPRFDVTNNGDCGSSERESGGTTAASARVKDSPRGFPGWLPRARPTYSDVGQELRVSCSSSSVAACHDLDVYLQLVKQLRPTKCPFTGMPVVDGVAEAQAEAVHHHPSGGISFPMQTAGTQ